MDSINLYEKQDPAIIINDLLLILNHDENQIKELKAEIKLKPMILILKMELLII